MYRAVVVDDERYDLEGLRQLIPWQELNIEVVCWEHRPLRALQFIEEHQIDLLITDIKMPILSGLELAKRAQDLNPSLKKCFISGYQDFEFAKKAIDLKADGYVLKPVDDHELIRVIKSIVSMIEQERDQQKALGETLDWRRQDSVLSLISGKQSKHWGTALADQLYISYPLHQQHVAVIEIDRSLDEELHTTARAQALLERRLEQVIRMFEIRGWLLWSKVAANRIAVILPHREQLVLELQQLQHELAEQQKLDTYISNIETGEYMSRVKSDFKLESELRHQASKEGKQPMTITIGLSDSVEHERELANAYEAAIHCLSYKMFLGKNRVITQLEIPQRDESKPEDIRPILDRMFQATMKYQLVEIYDCIEQLFDAVHPIDHPQKVYHFATYIALRLQHDLAQLNESFQSLLGWESNNLEKIAQFETIYDIQRWLRSTLFEISETVYMRKQRRNQKLFDEIVQYVMERLDAEITLKEVANYFAYSPNHLGYLFKETMGVSFNEYVLSQRMERAKELLRDHKLKVYEVADQTGYKSLTHFSRTFREAVGMTPGEYRKQSD